MQQSYFKKSAALFILTFIVILILYYPTALSIWREWLDSGTYSHGLILLPLCVILMYLRWNQYKTAIRIDPNILTLIVVLLISIIWILANLGNIQVIQQLTLVSLCALVPSALFGFRVGWKLLPPIALLFLAIPIWDFISGYLQTITAVVVNYLLNGFGIASIREGQLILVPAGVFEVAESCSGLRQFIVAIIIAVLITLKCELRIGISIIYVLATMLLAIIINNIRVFIVIAIGQYTNMQHPLVSDHAALGWILFGIIIFIWIYISIKFISRHDKFINLNDLQDKYKDTIYKTTVYDGFIWKIPLVVIIFSIGPLYYMYMENNIVSSQDIKIKLPDYIDNFKYKSFEPKKWQPIIHGADDIYTATYENEEGSSVNVLVYSYKKQKQGKEAIHVNNRLYNPLQWKMLDKEKMTFPTVSERELQVELTQIQTLSGDKRIVLQWYRTNKKDIASPFYAKVYNVLGILFGDPYISIIIVSTELDKDREIMNHRLRVFAQALKMSLDDAGL